MSDSLSTYTDTLIYNPKLSNLKPIFMPDPIKFEPITIGWYLILGLVFIILVFVIYMLFKKYQLKAYRRSSVREILKLEPEIGNSKSSELIQKISTILKTTAFYSYSREKVAKLSGADWQNFLISKISSGSNCRDTFAMLDNQYVAGKKIGSSEIEKLIDVSLKWIRRHRV
jgi:hypothetical protein